MTGRNSRQAPNEVTFPQQVAKMTVLVSQRIGRTKCLSSRPSGLSSSHSVSLALAQERDMPQAAGCSVSLWLDAGLLVSNTCVIALYSLGVPDGLSRVANNFKLGLACFLKGNPV